MKLITATMCSIAAATALTAQAEDQRPNIILVMADDQGYGDCGYTDHPFVKTPELDAMAKQSVVLDQFYAAAPVCSPTRASVMTGRHPMRTNVPNHGHYMRPNETTIAEALQASGYVTGHFGKWHIGSVQPESPTSPGQVGFDEWLTGLNFFDQDPYFAKKGGYIQLKGQGSVLTMDATIDFLEKHKAGDKPMFAVTWFPAPHDPHEEVPVDFPGADTLYNDIESMHGIKQHFRGYFLEITLLDQQVGRLRKALRDMNIADNTIVWYCSDNGGLVKESSGGRAKKGSIYEGGLRVPSLIEWPGTLKPQTISTPSNTSDIYPTILKIANATVTNQPPLDGVDLAPIIAGSQKERPAMGFWHGYTGGQPTWSDRIIKALMEAKQAGKPTPFPERLKKNIEQFPKRDRSNFNGHAAWTKWPWKLHRIVRGGKEKVELYNLSKDPMEQNDLSQKDPKQTQLLLKELESWQNSVFDSWEGKDYQ
ncbi:sulfatase-like hydrolase/transferase [Rubritalea tangerina]|uniref:Sulfatase-like hydrolase/transferase n=1 Tax=Rubritalea tangerina TaxID=430798 RepID=A0ABW4Z6X5_9BACT